MRRHMWMFSRGAVQYVLDSQLRFNRAVKFQELSFVISMNSYVVVFCFICSGYIMICHGTSVIYWSRIQNKDVLSVYEITFRGKGGRQIVLSTQITAQTPPPHPRPPLFLFIGIVARVFRAREITSKDRTHNKTQKACTAQIYLTIY